MQTHLLIQSFFYEIWPTIWSIKSHTILHPDPTANVNALFTVKASWVDYTSITESVSMNISINFRNPSLWHAYEEILDKKNHYDNYSIHFQFHSTVLNKHSFVEIFKIPPRYYCLLDTYIDVYKIDCLDWKLKEKHHMKLLHLDP